MYWNKVDVNTHNSAASHVFKKVILKFIRPETYQDFNVNSSKWIQMFYKNNTWKSHSFDYKVEHNFQDCVNPIGRNFQDCVNPIGRNFNLFPPSLF